MKYGLKKHFSQRIPETIRPVRNIINYLEQYGFPGDHSGSVYGETDQLKYKVGTSNATLPRFRKNKSCLTVSIETKDDEPETLEEAHRLLRLCEKITLELLERRLDDPDIKEVLREKGLLPDTP